MNDLEIAIILAEVNDYVIDFEVEYVEEGSFKITCESGMVVNIPETLYVKNIYASLTKGKMTFWVIVI